MEYKRVRGIQGAAQTTTAESSVSSTFNNSLTSVKVNKAACMERRTDGF